MAQSKCGSCNDTRFEIRPANNIIGATYKMNFVQCVACGAVVGVMSFFDAGVLANRIAEKIGA